MKAFKNAIFFLLLAGSIIGCSRKKNTFISRNWHAVTAEYNTLFNGNMALDLGKEELHQTYRDNYWEVLPVERMQVSETVLAPGTSVNPNFEIAEEKAVKAIQRHSMLLEGSEKNPQIDEAYLLLGKARYYDQRFVPALEAFNYILHKYPLSNTINEAKIWREKTNMRLEFNELAIKNLKKILKNEDLEKENRVNASASLAQAYLNIGAQDSAVAPIKKAAKLTKNKDEEGRYWFIAGQLYDRLENRDSANFAYSKVVDLKRKTPRIYLVNAKIAQLRNTDLSPEKKALVLQRLMDLSENRENRPYLDQIYFELAEFHYQQDSTRLAMDYYNRSLKSPSENALLQSLDYESLGNINFDAANYEVAGAYYDSTLQKLAQNTREYRIIKKKRDNLGDVIYYENLSRDLDSVIRIARLPEEEQRELFTAYTSELKEKMTSEAGKEEQAENAQNYFEKKRTGLPGVPTAGNTFYFYNPTTVAYGKQEFFRLWGDRELADNWRTGSRMAAATDLDSVGITELAENDPRLDPETYLQQIPKDPAMIDSLVQERNFSNYQLGLIYSGKFNEHALAAFKLESVLANDPEERLIVPAMYNLYKTYVELGELAKAQSLKNDIIYQFPDSRYAAILQNPESLLKDENNPTAMYEEVFQLYEDQKYAEVIEEATNLSAEFSGDEIVPKLELLKAMAQGRLLGIESYREGLNYVALNYPQAEEGKKAQEILQSALPTIANPVFKNDTLATSFKLVYPFETSEVKKAEELEKKISQSLEKLNYSHLKVSQDVYDPSRLFLVVHGFPSAERALGYAELLANKDYRVARKSFYISTENYKIAQIHKNIDTYLETLNPPQDVYTGKKGNDRAEQRTEQDSSGNKDNR